MSPSETTSAGSVSDGHRSDPLVEQFDRWAFVEYKLTAVDLALFRVLYATYALLFALPDVDVVTTVPDAALRPPPGPFSLLDAWPSDSVVAVSETLLVVALVALLVGYRTAVASIATTTMWFVCLGFLYSNGKISHSIAFFAVVPVFLALAGWGSTWSVDRWLGRKHVIRAWPVALAALTLGLMFFTAAIPKVQAGWLVPTTHAVQRSVLRSVFIDGQSNAFADWLVTIDSGLFWELIDLGTIALEAGLLLLVIRRRAFLGGLVLAVLLHFSIWKVLNINFQIQVASYAAFLHWESLLVPPRFRERSTRPAPQLATATRRVVDVAAGALVVATALAISWYADQYGSSRGALVPPLRADLLPWTYWIAMAMCAGFVLHSARVIVRSRRVRDAVGEAEAGAEPVRG